MFMTHDIAPWNVIVVLELVYYIYQRIHLLRGHPISSIITDNTYTDRLTVHIPCFTMRTVLLFDPAGGNLDLTGCFTIRSIIDDEMISKSVPKTSVQMRFIKRPVFS